MESAVLGLADAFSHDSAILVSLDMKKAFDMMHPWLVTNTFEHAGLHPEWANALGRPVSLVPTDCLDRWQMPQGRFCHSARLCHGPIGNGSAHG